MLDRLAPLVRSKCVTLAVAGVVALASSSPALAQWAWRDASGGVVYSDQAPPASIPDAQIFRRPAGRTPPPVAAPAPTAAAAPGAGPAATAATAAATAAPAKVTRPRTAAEQEQDFRKRQQERAEAEKKQAEEQSATARRAADCERARGYLRQLEDGMRIARTDAQGNREILDDSARNAEIQRTRDLVASSCK